MKMELMFMCGGPDIEVMVPRDFVVAQRFARSIELQSPLQSNVRPAHEAPAVTE
jgi:hypothetical protein